MSRVYDRNKDCPAKGVRLYLDYTITPELAAKYNVPTRKKGEPRVREPALTKNWDTADSRLRDREKQVHDGTWRPRDVEDMPFRGLAAMAIADMRTRRVRDVGDVEARLNTYVLPIIGERLCRTLRKRDHAEVVRKAWNDKAADLAPRSIHHIYEAERRVMQFGVDHDPPFLDEHFCVLSVKKKELPKKRDKDPRWRRTARDERASLEVLMGAPHDKVPLDRKAIYAATFFGGARQSEVLALQVRDYDRGARPLPRLCFAEQLDRQGENGETTALKGDGPVREAPVHPVGCTILEEWLLVGWPAMFGRQPRPDDLLFPSRRGPHIARSPNHMLKKLKQDEKRLGIPVQTNHSKRRALATFLQEDGAPKELIAAITHEGVATETRGVFRGYSVFSYEMLCHAVLKLRFQPRDRLPDAPEPIDVPGLPASLRTVQAAAMAPRGPAQGAGADVLASRRDEGWHQGWHQPTPSIQMTQSFQTVDSRGGRGSKRYTTCETPTNEAILRCHIADRDEDIVEESTGRGDVGTPTVPTLLPTELPSSLSVAADAMRSGRVQHMTAEWRGHLAAVCELAARLVLQGLADHRLDQTVRCTRCKTADSLPGRKRCRRCDRYMREKNRASRTERSGS